MLKKALVSMLLLVILSGFVNVPVSFSHTGPSQSSFVPNAGDTKTSQIPGQMVDAVPPFSGPADPTSGDQRQSNSDVDLKTAQFYVALLVRMGDIHFADKEWDAAKDKFERALKLQRHFLKRNPELPTLKRNVALILNRLGHFFQSSGELKEAIARYQESLVIMRQLAELQPENQEWQIELALYLCDSADVLQKGRSSDAAAAIPLIEEAYFRLLLSSEGDDLAKELAERKFHDVISICSSNDDAADVSSLFQTMVAVLAVEKEDYSAASAAQQKAVKLIRRYLYDIPELKDVLFDELTMACWYACLAGEFSLAVEAGEEAVSLLDHDNPCPARGNLAHAYLLNDQFYRAKGLYSRYAGTTFEGFRNWNQEVLADFLTLRKAGIYHSNMALIETLLQESSGEGMVSMFSRRQLPAGSKKMALHVRNHARGSIE